ncbi:MAG: hypothetical protein AAFX39_05395 [Pseudomonadota bacterium]
MIRFCLAAFATMALLVSANGKLDAQDHPEPAILTIYGAIGEANRGASDAFDDAFLGFNGRAFDDAFEFTLGDLRALDQVTIETEVEGWPRRVTATGPLLSDVLATAGVDPSAIITAIALDGYGAALDPEARASQEWVLALEADGRPLALGGRGPAWLMYASDTPVPTDAEGAWVWSVYLIEASLIQAQ